MANAQGKGRGGTKNFPSARFEPTTYEEKTALQKALDEVYDAYVQPKVKSDQELAERFNEYFEKCRARNSIPTVEEMFLYTGYGYDGMYDIETGKSKGFSPESSKIIKKAKQYLKSLDGKLALEGHINFLAYCFRAKNYYGMVDKVEHVVLPTMDQEQINTNIIKERYRLPQKKD